MRRVLITGVSRGLGLALSRMMLRDGWAVAGVARSRSHEVRDLEAEFPSFEFCEADLAEPSAVPMIAERFRLIHGIDAFASNAAIGTEGLLTLTPDQAIAACVQVNLVAPMRLAREVIKGMLKRGGSLVFIASVAARTGHSGLSVYGATKGGLVSFSRAIAREYGERGIRSNAVLPGFLETEMTASLNAADRERLQRRTALKRLGTVDDVIGTVKFLLSDEARYVTGAEWVVDGGMGA